LPEQGLKKGKNMEEIHSFIVYPRNRIQSLC
jgi:hypothetical protein